MLVARLRGVAGSYADGALTAVPRTRQARTAAPPLTTAQALGSLVNSARDIMRKDKGLSGDLDRLS